MPGPTAKELEFIDRFGLCFEKLGGTRTMGRIYAWLMICGAQQQSLTELAAALGVSKASISTVIRPMEEAGLALRLPAPGRQHSYRVAPGGVTRMLQVQFARMRLGAEVAEFGLSVLGKDRAAQRERLAEFRDFCEFTADEVGQELLTRWEQYRAKKRRKR
ncbi:GbsR/MarR family transcriptional regulator [Nannocystis punicea]|uniref:MarR family transcriptional regulator n=1 Tax=Nannocystis punicea TaxID=2995304 RepID=A0ABY7HBP1_9BACT|nr:hypothetical protein [Nannocystis poenicansa]WAS96689.1 hypothetical protein O0S08_11110 [Nannocystis poenicansa]